MILSHSKLTMDHQLLLITCGLHYSENLQTPPFLFNIILAPSRACARTRGWSNVSLPVLPGRILWMTDRDSFYPLHYLRPRFGDLNDQRATYVLGQLHNVLHRYVSKRRSDCELLVLDFGCGPVIQNCISVATFASEIMFSDISSANREAIQKWLDGDADAFNWSPHFDYVVKTLEGKGEKEAREREQRVRQISKVVFCDALSETPMQKGYEGPYDVILQCACLECACSDIESFKNCMKKLTSLLKSGGLLFDYATDAAVDTLNLQYPVGDRVHSYISLTHNTVASVMEECGLRDVEVNFTSLNPQSQFGQLTSKTPRGFHAISGVKP